MPLVNNEYLGSLMKKITFIAGILSLALISTGLIAESAKLTKKDEDAINFIRLTMTSKIPAMQIDDIVPSEVDGIYELFADGEIYYITADAKYIFAGKLLGLSNGIENLTNKSMAMWNERQAPMRQQKLAAIPEQDMVVFKAKQEKHVVTVFTDVDCGYCRKLHNEMEEYNDLGITVRYMAYPRAGKPSDSYDKLAAVWCSDDKQKSMTRAKNRQSVAAKSCKHPIDSHMKLVRDFGLSGTPAIVTEKGQLIGGYVEPKKLLDYLNQLQNNS